MDTVNVEYITNYKFKNLDFLDTCHFKFVYLHHERVHGHRIIKYTITDSAYGLVIKKMLESLIIKLIYIK